MELLRSGLPSYYYICKLQTEYDMENRLTVGFTHGDVNGIGYELIIKMMAENRNLRSMYPGIVRILEGGCLSSESFKYRKFQFE